MLRIVVAGLLLVSLGLHGQDSSPPLDPRPRLLDGAEAAIEQVPEARRHHARLDFLGTLIDLRESGRAVEQVRELLRESPDAGSRALVDLHAAGLLSDEALLALFSEFEAPSPARSASHAYALLLDESLEAALEALPSMVDQPNDRVRAIATLGAALLTSERSDELPALLLRVYDPKTLSRIVVTMARRLARHHRRADLAASLLPRLAESPLETRAVIWEIACAHRRASNLPGATEWRNRLPHGKHRLLLSLWLARSWVKEGETPRGLAAWRDAVESWNEAPPTARRHLEFFRSGREIHGESWPARLRELVESGSFRSDHWGRAAAFAFLGDLDAVRQAAREDAKVLPPDRRAEFANRTEERAFWLAFIFDPWSGSFRIENFQRRSSRQLATAVVEASSNSGFDRRISREANAVSRRVRRAAYFAVAEYAAVKLSRGEREAATRATDVVGTWPPLHVEFTIEGLVGFPDAWTAALRRRGVDPTQCAEFALSISDPERRLSLLLALLNPRNPLDERSFSIGPPPH